MNGQGIHEGTQWRLQGPMDSDRLQAEVASPGSTRPKRQRNEAASSCSLSFGCEVQSPGVASSSSIEDETYGGMWSTGNRRERKRGEEVRKGVRDVRCEGMGFGVGKRLRWKGGQKRVWLEQGNQVGASMGFARPEEGKRDRGNHERLLPRGLAGSCHHFRWFLTGNEYEDGSERCWSVVLLLLKRSMEGNGSKQTHLWCWYDAVG
ncbi:uncharacterized protein LOC128126658 isoform X2 [Lactuca sativa]|uniref:uncharacterized protein LOC128126658 isoform X2 n=1 Tax=Lactuca sativa TaxID=4236 RepID=UPI0022AEA504|nr:uncharacterized protein LOC128126658 isoform X2 [Lactuca sativa]